MDTHSTVSGNTDSTKPTMNHQAFALLESEAALQRFVGSVEGRKAAKACLDARRACCDGSVLCF
ncbi:MAG TPA: hypothetical protein VN943_10765 [Candidatus Acidoferrum sp.]|nr:hypothetical protein [Candidatus Acidoferrum sp.]